MKLVLFPIWEIVADGVAPAQQQAGPVQLGLYSITGSPAKFQQLLLLIWLGRGYIACQTQSPTGLVSTCVGP